MSIWLSPQYVLQQNIPYPDPLCTRIQFLSVDLLGLYVKQVRLSILRNAAMIVFQATRKLQESRGNSYLITKNTFDIAQIISYWVHLYTSYFGARDFEFKPDSRLISRVAWLAVVILQYQHLQHICELEIYQDFIHHSAQ